MPIGWLTSPDAMVPIGGSRLTDCAYPTWCMCTPTPSNPINPKQYRSPAFRDVHAGNYSTWVGGAGWWDNLFCLLLNSGLSCLSALLLLAFTYFVCLTSFALCPAGWLRFRCCRFACACLPCRCCCRCLSSRCAALCLVPVFVWLVRPISISETCF